MLVSGVRPPIRPSSNSTPGTEYLPDVPFVGIKMRGILAQSSRSLRWTPHRSDDLGEKLRDRSEHSWHAGSCKHRTRTSQYQSFALRKGWLGSHDPE
jgi:hypothetical protein